MDSLDPPIRERVVSQIEQYLADPARPGAAKPLTGRPGYFRLRAGDWRVVFFLEETSANPPMMVIEQVAHRREVYQR